jgi:hypothetical protein
MNPQISAPARVIPNIFINITPETEYAIYYSVDQLSPNHLDAHFPRPVIELLSIIIVLLFCD